MKLLNVDALQDKKIHSLEDEIISVANYWNRNYELMYADCWNFEYQTSDESPDTLGDRISDGKAGKMASLMKAYHGISMKRLEDHSAEELYSIIINEIDNDCPVIVGIDVFWIPWVVDAYQKFHINYHFPIVIGYNDEGLLFNDSEFNKTNALISKNDLLQGMGQCITFTKSSNEQAVTDINSLIMMSPKRMISQINGFNSFDRLRMFGDEIASTQDWLTELKDVELKWMSPLLLHVANCGLYRSQYGMFIEYVSKIAKDDELCLMGEEFAAMGKSWNKLKNLITKLTVSSNTANRLMKCKELIYDIANNEEILCNRILEWEKNSGS